MTKPDTLFFSSPIFKMCNWIYRDSCGTSNFPLRYAFCSFDCDFVRHVHPEIPQAQWTHRIVLHRFVCRDTRQQMDPFVILPTWWYKTWWSWNQDATNKLQRNGEAECWEKKNPAFVVRKLCNAGFFGTLNCLRWDRSSVLLAKQSKNRTILRQVPGQGAIYFLGTISSYDQGSCFIIYIVGNL